jgi:hypothetical protein
VCLIFFNQTEFDSLTNLSQKGAANVGRAKILNSLISKGKFNSEQLEKKDNFGSTPLHFASVRNLTESVYALVCIVLSPIYKYISNLCEIDFSR